MEAKEMIGDGMTHCVPQLHLHQGRIGHQIASLEDLQTKGDLALQTEGGVDPILDHAHLTAGNEGGILHLVKETHTLQAKNGLLKEVRIHVPLAEAGAIDPQNGEIAEMTNTEKRTGETGTMTKTMTKILQGEVGSQTQKPLTNCVS